MKSIQCKNYTSKILCITILCTQFFINENLFSQSFKIKSHPFPAMTDGMNPTVKMQQCTLRKNDSKKGSLSSIKAPQANTIYVNDNSTVGDVYTTATGDDIIGDGSASAPYATISHAIAVAFPGDIIKVDAGAYVEEIEVDKQLSLQGSNYNINPVTGVRNAESIIYPAFSDPDPYSVNSRSIEYLDATAGNSKIDGFTFDGDNPNLTSGIIINGADVDAIEAIGAYDGIAGVVISNNIIKNTSYAGVDFDNYNNGGTPTTDNLVTANYFNNIMPSIYGIAVIIYDNCYTTITNNKMTSVRIGVQTGNFFQADPGNSHTIQTNNIESSRLGIWHNLAYNSAANFIIDQNSITTFSGAINNNGIEISSLQISVGAAVTNNNINGAHIGYNLWNNPTTDTVNVSGGAVTNCGLGVFANNYDGYASNAASSNYVLDAAAISGADTGIYVKDNILNTNSATVSLVVKNNTTISSGVAGVRIEGADASVYFAGSNPLTLSNESLYLQEISNGNNAPAQPIDASMVLFDGNTGMTMNSSNLFTTEDKIIHKMDDLTLGFVTVKEKNDFVTANSGSIQKGIDLSSDGWTVNVGAGTYNESLLVNKKIIIKGVQAGIQAKTRTGDESIVDPNVSTSHGFKIVTDSVTIDGFTITNSAPYPSTSQERYGVVTIDKNGTGNFTEIAVENNIIERQFKAIDFNYTDNFQLSGNWLHGENDNYNYGCTWIASYGASSSNGLITNNDLDGYSSAIEIQGNGTQPVSNLTISENRSNGSQYVLFGLQNSTVYRNTVLDVTTGSHVFIGGGCSNDVFTENFFDSGLFNGINISNNYGAGINSALTINSNSITGHTNPGYYDIKVTPSAYVGTLDATCNWLDTANGAVIATRVNGPVNYGPWLTSKTDNDAAPGFQPVPGSCSGTPISVSLASVINASCKDSLTGAININVSGGSSIYTYSWSNGATTQNITGISAGTYSVTVSDTYGQTQQLNNIVITEPAQLVANGTQNEAILCYGGSTTITVSASGGTYPYSGTGTFTTGAGNYNYPVTDVNGCTASASGTVAQPAQLIVHATAGTIQCPGGSTTVAVTATGGTIPYSGTGTFNAYAGLNTYSVSDANSCTASTTINIPDGTGTAPAKPAKITGSQYNLCGGGIFTYTVSTVFGATSYSWIIPSGFSLQSQTANHANIQVPAVFTTAQIGATANNACGSSDQRNLTLYAVTPNPSSKITGPSSVSAFQTNVQYKLPDLTGVVYTWSVPTGASIVSGQGTNKILVNFGNKSGSVKVFISNSCGNSPTGSLFVTVSGAISSAEENSSMSGDLTAKLYPNPAKTETNLSFNAPKAGSKYEIEVSDVNGRSLLSKEGTTNSGVNMIKINLSNFANGVYLVRLISDDNVSVFKVYKE